MKIRVILKREGMGGEGGEEWKKGGRRGSE
jgi:hypothetical protein